MTRLAIMCAALLLSVPAAAQDQLQLPGDAPLPDLIDPQAAPGDFDLARKKVVECEGEKFVFSWGAGARPTKVTLCSKEGATPDEVIQMLDDAATKVEQTEGIAEDRRVAIVQQIRAKISELQGAATAAAAPPPEPRSAVAQLPAKAPTPAVPPTVVPVANSPAMATTPGLATKPNLSVECHTPGEFGTGGPCTTLGRDTRLTITAGEAIAGATALRFVRSGQSRAELKLAQMRKGQSVRLTLPRAVCTGVVKADTEIQVVRAGRVVDSMGPYLLRC